MIQMNRETITLAGVLIALASCVYMYKELQKVQQQQQQQSAAAAVHPLPAVIVSQAPVNDAKETSPVVVEKK